jgi:F-type H+-transporting ATPase subunit c
MLGRFGGAGFALGLGGIGAAVGMGMAAGQANEGIMRQPSQQGYLLRTMLIGQAVGGSPSIFALVIGFLILFVGVAPGAAGGNLFAALLGAGLCVGLGCLGSGVGCGWPSGGACDGVARNPSRISQVTTMMIVGQAVAQSPSIFATVIALILVLLFRNTGGTDWSTMGLFIGGGLAMGASALGAGMGSGKTAGGGVEGLGRWPRVQGLTLRTMLIGQAVCETPAIFGMLVSLIMLFGMGGLENTLVGFSKALGAGIAVGFGGIGPGLGSGLAGGAGAAMTAARPRLDAVMLRTMLIGQAVAQSTSIYALIIALLLLFAM